MDLGSVLLLQEYYILSHAVLVKDMNSCLEMARKDTFTETDRFRRG